MPTTDDAADAVTVEDDPVETTVTVVLSDPPRVAAAAAAIGLRAKITLVIAALVAALGLVEVLALALRGSEPDTKQQQQLNLLSRALDGVLAGAVWGSNNATKTMSTTTMTTR